MVRFKTLVLLLSSLNCLSCNQTETPLEQAQAMQCQSAEELTSNQVTLRDIEENYCTSVLSDLAPTAPDGIKPKWSRPNPYPALPDYFLYPDTNPMQINGRRLQSIATCMHKRCLNLRQTPESYCGAPKCKQNRGAFILNTFLKLADVCTAEPYTIRRMVERIRTKYKKQTQQDIQWCSAAPSGKTRDLRIAFGESVDACQPGAQQCPNDYRCAKERFGYRCRPLKPILPPEIPGIAFQAATKPQPEGGSCQFSKDCQADLVCGHAAGAYGICAKPCSTQADCNNTSQCYHGTQQVSFCNPACNPDTSLPVSAKKQANSLCIPAGTSGRTVQLTRKQILDAAQKSLPHLQKLEEISAQQMKKLIENLNAEATCGNGILEAPELCDLGTENGKVQRGSWCTQQCTLAECGNSILEPGETCECTLEFQDAFHRSEEIRKLYQLPTTCPGRHAISNGSEKALGFSCHSCSIIHARHMRETRQNPYFLPEFDPFNPPQN